MRWRRFQFPLLIFGFALLWLCVRFPYEAESIASKLTGSSNGVDPRSLHLGGEFVESNLGTAVDADGAVTGPTDCAAISFCPSLRDRARRPAGALSHHQRRCCAPILNRWNWTMHSKSCPATSKNLKCNSPCLGSIKRPATSSAERGTTTCVLA